MTVTTATPEAASDIATAVEAKVRDVLIDRLNAQKIGEAMLKVNIGETFEVKTNYPEQVSDRVADLLEDAFEAAGWQVAGLDRKDHEMTVGQTVILKLVRPPVTNVPRPKFDVFSPIERRGTLSNAED